LIERHLALTGSSRARSVLDAWDRHERRMRHIVPMADVRPRTGAAASVGAV
jgi:glutamate synthase domain-containing protein 3